MLKPKRNCQLNMMIFALVGGYRLDLLVNDCVAVEAKGRDKLGQLHMAQLLTCLKLGHYLLGCLLNFSVVHVRGGIKRIVNGL